MKAEKWLDWEISMNEINEGIVKELLVPEDYSVPLEVNVSCLWFFSSLHHWQLVGLVFLFIYLVVSIKMQWTTQWLARIWLTAMSWLCTKCLRVFYMGTRLILYHPLSVIIFCNVPLGCQWASSLLFFQAGCLMACNMLLTQMSSPDDLCLWLWMLLSWPPRNSKIPSICVVELVCIRVISCSFYCTHPLYYLYCPLYRASVCDSKIC